MTTTDKEQDDDESSNAGAAGVEAHVLELMKKVTESSNSNTISSEREEKEAYRDRLCSYSAATYFAKPPSISPIICSRFGWRNVGRDMLTCDGCKNALAPIFKSNLSLISIRKLTCLYENRLSEAHKETCCYRESAACYVTSARARLLESSASTTEPPVVIPTLLESLFTKDDLQLMDHVHPLNLFAVLVKRVQSSLKEKHPQQGLPKLETPKNLLFYDPIRKPGESDLPPDHQTLLERLVELLTTVGTGDNEFISLQKTQSPVHVESLVTLVLLGWRPPTTLASDDASDSTVSPPCATFSCPLCLASLSIELLGADSSDVDHGNSLQQQQQQPNHKNKRQRRDPPLCNPLAGHKHYCPHICGFPINGAYEAKPLWQSVADRLLSPPPAFFVLSPDSSNNNATGQGGDTSAETMPAQPGAWERIHKMLAAGISRK